MIFDLHNDLPTGKLSNKDKRLEYVNTSDDVIYAFWTTELSDAAGFIRNGINELFSANQAFAIEDLGFANRLDVETIYDIKPYYCGLTHNGDNALAGGALGHGRLTAFGKTTVNRLNRAAIAIDSAHLNRESFFDVANAAYRLINTHTGLNSLCEHPRNLTDEQVKLILSRGGIVGLTAVRDFIGGNSSADYIRLIDGFVQKFGIDGACIGTDFHGTEPLENLRNYDDFEQIEYALENLGYESVDVRKIFYDNANNYFKYRRYNPNETRHL